MAASLVISTLLGVLGLGVILPTNLIVFLELRKREPDSPKIARLMQRYIYAVALQGALQVGIVIVMSRFATGI